MKWELSNISYHRRPFKAPSRLKRMAFSGLCSSDIAEQCDGWSRAKKGGASRTSRIARMMSLAIDCCAGRDS